MTFDDLAFGDSLFVDANPLVYYFAGDPAFGAACRRLVQRIETQDLLGFTSTHVLGEVAHRLMILEAVRWPGWAAGKVKKRLRQQPGALQNLTRFRTATETILQSRLQVLTIAPSLLGAAAAVSQQHGLLTNDALTLAWMQAHGLTRIASGDTDFDRVLGLTRYAPA
jgi:predicted nucleic acid-binding protein